MLRKIYEALPPGAKSALKKMLGAQGHGESAFDRLKATNLANGKKRLDIAAQQFSERLHYSGISSLQSAVCLELGAGYVLSEPLLFHLLGCERAYATDYNAIASARATYQSIRNTTPDAVAAALSSLTVPSDFDLRLNNLFNISKAEFPEFLRRTVTYRAPYDGATEEPISRFDFIHSVSVLEHIPKAVVPPLLANFASQLADLGVWINHIDLKDHRDMKKDPFAFLASDTDWCEKDTDGRGNRLRKSDWLTAFSVLPLDTKCVFERKERPDTLPARLIADCASELHSELIVGEVILRSFRH